MANEITAEQVAELRALADRCDRHPYGLSERAKWHRLTTRREGGPEVHNVFDQWGSQVALYCRFEIAGLIVAMHEALPALLSELERLQGLEARVKGAPEARIEWQQHVGMVLGSCRLSSDLIGRRVALLALDGEGVLDG